MATTVNKWTSEELDILVKYYPLYKSSYVASLIPRHTEKGIKNKANYLGLRARKDSHHYVAFILQNPTCSNARIADIAGCSASTISYHRRTHGLKRIVL